MPLSWLWLGYQQRWRDEAHGSIGKRVCWKGMRTQDCINWVGNPQPIEFSHGLNEKRKKELTSFVGFLFLTADMMRSAVSRSGCQCLPCHGGQYLQTTGPNEALQAEVAFIGHFLTAMKKIKQSKHLSLECVYYISPSRSDTGLQTRRRLEERNLIILE